MKSTCKHCNLPIFMGRLRTQGFGWQLDEGGMYGQVFCDARDWETHEPKQTEESQ